MTLEAAQGAPKSLQMVIAAMKLRLPLGLVLGSPIFPSGCEGKLGVALESLHFSNTTVQKHQFFSAQLSSHLELFTG